MTYGTGRDEYRCKIRNSTGKVAVTVVVNPAPEPHPFYDVTKRGLDIVLASILLVLTSPVLVAACALIAVTSGFPLFFHQRRMGYLAREFDCWKLRTMTQDAEARRQELFHLNEMDGPAFKLAQDPRLTKVGAVLRKTSIDELPQLWNVLRGDMSLVGPRPLPIVENQYHGEQALRLSVKPGLTCIWQVSGRSKVTFERWMEMDVQYVRQRSLPFDLGLILRTPPAIFKGRGAV